MFDYVKKILSDSNYVVPGDTVSRGHGSNEKQLQVATAAVFIEMVLLPLRKEKA
jgi:hypothetical protein